MSTYATGSPNWLRQMALLNKIEINPKDIKVALYTTSISAPKISDDIKVGDEIELTYRGKVTRMDGLIRMTASTGEDLNFSTHFLNDGVSKHKLIRRAQPKVGADFHGRELGTFGFKAGTVIEGLYDNKLFALDNNGRWVSLSNGTKWGTGDFMYSPDIKLVSNPAAGK